MDFLKKNFSKISWRSSYSHGIVLILCSVNLVAAFLGIEVENNSDITKALSFSLSFQISIFASIVAALPTGFDVLLDLIYTKSLFVSAKVPKRELFSGILITDIIIVSILVPLDLSSALVAVVNFRDSLIICVILVYINKLGANCFRWWLLTCIGGCFLLCNLLDTYSFTTTDVNFLGKLQTIFYVLIGLAFFILACLGVEWSLHVYNSLKKNSLSESDFICSLYFIFFIIFVVQDWGIFVYVPNISDNPDWSTTGQLYLTMYNWCLVLGSIGITILTIRMNRAEKQFVSHSLETRKAFMRYISHEIRTPLNIILAGLKVMEEEIQRSVPAAELMETILDIRSSCSIAVDTLSEVLTYDKVESRKMSLDISKFRLCKFIYETLRPFYLQASAGGIILSVQFDHATESVDPMLHADMHKLSQVFRNLMSNALKFTPKNGTVKVNICSGPRGYLNEVQASQRRSHPKKPSNEDDLEDCVRIEVVDSGAGISPENQKKLFKDVVQFNPGKLQAGGGTGLGLYISKGIVDLHQGELSVSSVGEGCGTTFILLLPLSQHRDPKDRSMSNPGTNKSRRLSTMIHNQHGGGDNMVANFRNGRMRSQLTLESRLAVVMHRSVSGIGAQLLCAAGSFRSRISPGPSLCGGSMRVLGDLADQTLDTRPMLTVRVKSATGMDREGSTREVSQRSSRWRNSVSAVATDTKSSTKKAEEVGSRRHSAPTEPNTGRSGRSFFTKQGSSSWAVEHKQADVCADVSVSRRERRASDCMVVGEDERGGKSGKGVSSDGIDFREGPKGDVQEVKRSPHLIVVDDSAPNRKMLSRLMRGRCVVCEQAVDGLDGVEKVSQAMRDSDGYDVVLMDFEMPKMNGPQAAKELRELGFKGIIIGLTGNTGTEEINKFLSHGADHVLCKPLDVQKYDDIIRNANFKCFIA